MNANQKIDKIFGSDYTENRFQSKFEKSQFVNINLNNSSSKNSERKLIKPKKFSVNSFQKQFTNVENNKKDKKRTIGYIDINFYSKVLKNVNENNKDNIDDVICKSNKIKKNKSIINPMSHESKSNKNIMNFKDSNNNNYEEKKVTNIMSNEKKNSKTKKRKDTVLNAINSNNNKINDSQKLIEKRNKLNEVQSALQLEIKSKRKKYKDYIIEKIEMPNYMIIEKENKLNNKSNNTNILNNNNETNPLNQNFKKDFSIEIKNNNFQTIYNVNNKKNRFLCCF